MLGFVEDLYCAAATHWRMLHCKAPLYKAWNTHVDDLMLYWHAQAITSFHLLLPSWITLIYLFFTKSALVI